MISVAILLNSSSEAHMADEPNPRTYQKSDKSYPTIVALTFFASLYTIHRYVPFIDFVQWVMREWKRPANQSRTHPFSYWYGFAMGLIIGLIIGMFLSFFIWFDPSRKDSKHLIN